MIFCKKKSLPEFSAFFFSIGLPPAAVRPPLHRHHLTRKNKYLDKTTFKSCVAFFWLFEIKRSK